MGGCRWRLGSSWSRCGLSWADRLVYAETSSQDTAVVVHEGD